MIKQEELNNIPDLKTKAINYVFEKGLVQDDGLWLEFGVYDGGTLLRMSKYTEKTIYGFDSFEGLPEDWTGRVEPSGLTFPKGTFNLRGNMPWVPDNVHLVKGWFCNTIPPFIKENDKQVSFIHIDSDIYSSCKDILEGLVAHMKNGCVIVFDELVGYSNFENHEWKAWWEFVEKYNVKFEWIGGNPSRVDLSNPFDPKSFDYGRTTNVSPSYENAAVRILENPSFKF